MPTYFNLLHATRSSCRIVPLVFTLCQIHVHCTYTFEMTLKELLIQSFQ